MTIKKAQLSYFKKGALRGGEQIHGNRHVKTLPYLSIVEAVEGSYSIALGKGEVQNTGSRGFFIAPAHVSQSITHHVDPLTRRIHCRWIFLELLLNDGHTPEELFELPTTLTGDTAAPMHDIFDRLFSAPTLLGEQGLGLAAAEELLRHSSPLRAPRASPLHASLSYIHTHYATPIRVPMLAELECTSEANYYNLFRRVTGTSPIAYINSYRLSLAAEAMIATDRSISAIAASVGIPDALYFSRLFLRTHGQTPTQYRQTHKDN